MPVSSRPAEEERSRRPRLVRTFASQDVSVSPSWFASLSSLHLKRNAVHNPQDESGKAVIVRSAAADDLPYRLTIVWLQTPSQGIHQKFLSQASRKGIPVLIKDGF